MAHEDTATQPEESPTLIRTKLNRPRPVGDLVPRPRLLARLDRDLERKLTLVTAPAGYGKSTLLLQWLEACPYRTGWLSLDARDSDLAVFLSYFLAAIRTVFPDACSTAGELLRAPQLPPPDHLAAVLINELAELPEPLMLVVDDYHYIRDPSAHELLNRMLRYLPTQVQLVIATRTDPPLALDRLRAERQMLEMRGNDLRFSTEEAQTYLELELGSDVTPEIVTLLEQRTEGWIVGLHLAALWMRGAEDYAAVLDGFQGDSTRFVVEYLIAEVLTQQSADVQQFLLLTSILDRFCAPLCDALLDERLGTGDVVGHSSPSRAILDELDQASLFLIPLDEEHGWYRHHHLFRQMLRQRLHAQTTSDQVVILHQRASRWFAGHGYVEEALQHALAADDVEAAVTLVEENSQDLLNRLERHTLERWLSMLPKEVVWGRPRLLVVQAWLLYRQWRLRALDAVLDRAEACLDADCGAAFTARETQSINGHINVLRSATAYFVHKDYQRSLSSAEQALQQLPDGERGSQSTALAYWALAHQALGEKEKAVRRLEGALHDPSQLGPSKIQAFIGLSSLHLLAGDLHQMQQTTCHFLTFAVENKNVNAIVGANWVSGLLQYERNNLGAASSHFSDVIQRRYRSNFAAAFSSVLGLARIFQVQGELGKAQELIDSLRTETLRLNNTNSLPALDSIQANQWLLSGNVDSALRWARGFHSGELEEPVVWFEVPSLTRARILLSYGTASDLQALRHDLEEVQAAAKARHFTQRMIQTLAHLALAYDRLRRTDDALEALQQALKLAQPGRFIRSFIDVGPALRPLLRRLSRLGVASPDYLTQILAAFDTVPQAESPPSTMSAPPEAGTIDLLTSREEEILRLMQDGLTNQEIADELIISLYTVKRHATNIYTKLGVNNRRQAIRKSKQLGILPTN